MRVCAYVLYVCVRARSLVCAHYLMCEGEQLDGVPTTKAKSTRAFRLGESCDEIVQTKYTKTMYADENNDDDDDTHQDNV